MPELSQILKIAVIEDQTRIRESLGELIAGSEKYVCVGSYPSMELGLAGIEERSPDVILCDIGLPGMNGIEGVKIIRERFPNTLVIMLTVYDDNERIVEAICAGASGYLLKNTPPDKLFASIDEVAAGGAPMSPEIARTVIDLFRINPPPKQVDHGLTPHETRILKMLVDGHNYKTAAAELGVSINTVSFHMRHIYEKLQVHSKSEAVAKALKSGIV
ncbi:response regulator [Leptolyngbya sp. 7M]|uniref:response regulator n=1 Tax=Leptolyngbya sp. 7M TaxID=2812896 RepID=UPI001B8C0322|nr:response regulator transcription factor [Leptolyngbya sp. 7M]QYO64753.1 response regulator transcription factor [Leptolyngbya sp. 7M]